MSKVQWAVNIAVFPFVLVLLGFWAIYWLIEEAVIAFTFAFRD